MKHKETCHHPELAPTQWNQPKPEPYTGDTCDCGMNFICPICGYGHCCSPCGCTPRSRGKLYSPACYGSKG